MAILRIFIEVYQFCFKPIDCRSLWSSLTRAFARQQDDKRFGDVPICCTAYSKKGDLQSTQL